MTDPSGTEAIGFEVLRAIRRIIRSISAHSRELSRTSGLTVPQLIALKAIDEQGPLTVGQLGKSIQLSAATTSRIADRLARADLLIRTRDQADRRRVTLSLTESGQARCRSLPRPLQDRVLARLAQMPEAERLALLGALEQVVGLLDAEDVDAAPVLAPEHELQPGG